MEETFGLTTAESMACGTPALVYDSTACPEIVTEKTGFVIAPHNIDRALKAIQQLKLVGKQYYGNNCRSYILENFRKEDKYKEYAALYQELL
jgi:putative colanic acid biosynthesis glycosyltransferase